MSSLLVMTSLLLVCSLHSLPLSHSQLHIDDSRFTRLMTTGEDCLDSDNLQCAYNSFLVSYNEEVK